MRILGIDPGSQVTGFGLVERADAAGGGALRHVAHGTLRPPAGLGLAERMAWLYRGIQEVARRHEPERAVVEQVFVSASARSALVLGQARGGILAALGESGVPVDELGAREIKKAVTGHGAAPKAQVQEMVRRLLGLDRVPAADAADALAAALCRLQGAAGSGPELWSEWRAHRGRRGRRRALRLGGPA